MGKQREERRRIFVDADPELIREVDREAKRMNICRSAFVRRSLKVGLRRLYLVKEEGPECPRHHLSRWHDGQGNRKTVEEEGESEAA